MDKPIEVYWEKRLHTVQRSLTRNNFDAYYAANKGDAQRLIFEEILPTLELKTVGLGGSATLHETGVYDLLVADNNLDVLEAAEGASWEEKIEVRRRSLLTDLFVTSSNAVTEEGTLVNLDMIGNRVAGLTFGPKHVIVMVGRNKIVTDLESAVERVKEYSAPVNAIRLDMKTPCAVTGECADCRSVQRICNSWTITEKSFPKHRVKVILINEDLGF